MVCYVINVAALTSSKRANRESQWPPQWCGWSTAATAVKTQCSASKPHWSSNLCLHMQPAGNSCGRTVFGFTNLCHPSVFKLDFSMAVITAINMSFNCVKLDEYIQFCWGQINNELTLQTSDNRFVTVIHVCVAHFMKCVRDCCLFCTLSV